jgi:Tol biopolymer transport system component
MVVFEFSYLANPTQGAGIFVYRTLRRDVVIENTCPSPPPPPAGGLIVFSNTPPVGAPDRDAEVWTLDLATGIATQLTDNVQIADMDPAWSPDRSWIALVSNRVSPAGGDFDLVVMNADGSGPQIVTDFDPLNESADDPAWSPVVGERRIAFSRGRTGFAGNDIWVLDLDEPEASAARLRQITSGVETDMSPSWRPNGQEIAFNRNGLIHVVPAAGGASSLLYAPADPDDFVGAPDWGPEGIVFERYVFAISRTRLVRIDDAGGSFAEVTAGGDHLADVTPSWSVTPREVIFSRFGFEVGTVLYGVTVDDDGPNAASVLPGQPPGNNIDPDCGFGPRP